MRKPAIACLLLLLGLLLACQDDAAKLQEHLTRGETYADQGQLREAIIEFKSALQLDPNNADAHYQLAHAYLRSQKAREGFWELRETVRLAPDNRDAVLEFCQLAVVAGETDEAIAQTTRLIEANPQDAQAFLVRGQAYSFLKEYEKSYEDFNAALTAEPENEAALRAVARLETRRKNLDTAMELYERLVAAHPTFDNYALMARTARGVGGVEQQLDLLRKGLEVAEGKQRTVAYSSLTSVLVGEGRDDEALALLQHGIETEDEVKLDLIYLMARLYKSRGDADKAQELVVEATRTAPDDPRTYLVLASYRVREQDDLPAALEAVGKALELDPDNRLAKLQKAEILSELGFRGDERGSVEEAAEILAKVIAEEPSNPDALIVDAKIKLGSGDLAGATQQLRAVLDTRPNWAQAHYLLGLALAAQQDYAGARVELGRALEIDSNHLEAKLVLAQVHYHLGEWEYCVERAREYLRGRPDSSKARLILAQALVRMNRIQDAERELLEIPEDQRDGEVLFALGRIQQAYGNNDNARELLLDALEKYPTNFDVLQALMALDRSQDRMDESAARIAKAVEAEPDNSRLQQLAGVVAFNQGKQDEAEKYFQRSIELDPTDMSAYERLARFYARTGRLEQTTKTYEDALAVNPEEAQIHHFLGVLYELAGDRERAIQRYEDAVRYGPNLSEAKNNLAYLYADSNRNLDRALDLAQDAKADLPDNPSVSDTLGWVLYKRGVPSAAIGYLKEAEAATDPTDASMGVVQYHLAQAYEANGETGQAVASLDDALGTLASQMQAVRDAGKEPGDEPAWAAEARAMRDRLQGKTAAAG